MNINDHILQAFEGALNNNIDKAMLHICIAIDALSQKKYHKEHSSRKIYTDFIRSYYWILEPMMGAGLNLKKTQWTNINLKDNNGKNIDNKDIANVIYHIFRCNIAHGKQIPEPYKIQATYTPLAIQISKNTLHLPYSLIWALIAVCVFTKENKGQQIDCPYHLTLGNNHFAVSDWVGLETSFRPIAKKYTKFRVTLKSL